MLSPFPGLPSSPIRKDYAEIQRRDNPLGIVGACSLPHLRVLATAPRVPSEPTSCCRAPHDQYDSPVSQHPSILRAGGLIDVGGGYETCFVFLDAVLMAERL